MNEQMQLAKFLAANAYGFHHVAKLIAKEEWLDANEGRFDPWPLFYTNLGYTIELYLKAYIAFRGGTKAELENDIRHDLKRALKRALELNLTTPGDTVCKLIDTIGPHHKKRSFVYLTHGDIAVGTLPDFDTALAASEQLMTTIFKQVPIDDLFESKPDK